jgi:hypothetical protein
MAMILQWVQDIHPHHARSVCNVSHTADRFDSDLRVGLYDSLACVADGAPQHTDRKSVIARSWSFSFPCCECDTLLKRIEAALCTMSSTKTIHLPCCCHNCFENFATGAQIEGEPHSRLAQHPSDMAAPTATTDLIPNYRCLPLKARGHRCHRSFVSTAIPRCLGTVHVPYGRC